VALQRVQARACQARAGCARGSRPRPNPLLAQRSFRSRLFIFRRCGASL